MRKQANNYAFIDNQNILLGVRGLGWRLDWARFRKHLAEKYAVTTAYQFIGFLPANQPVYTALQRAGFQLIFKETVRGAGGKHKGNVDAELVLQAMIDYAVYERAVIVSSDGDFACLVRHLKRHDKLHRVISPAPRTCSVLLKKAAEQQIDFLEGLREKLAWKK